MAPARGGDDGTVVEVVPVEDGAPEEPAPRERRRAAGEDGRGIRRWRARLELVVATALVLTAVVAQGFEQRREAARDARFAAMAGTVPPMPGRLEPAWHEDPWYSTFHEVGGLVVLTRSGGTVRAVDGATGAERWTLDEPVLGCWPPATNGRVDDPAAGEPASDALLCRGRSPGTGSPDVMMRLLLVAGTTGEVLAEGLAGTPAYAPALVGHDVVLVRASPDRLTVVRRGLADATPRWRAELPGSPLVARGGGRVTVRHGLVVLSGAVTAVLDADDGRVLGSWTARASARGGRVPDPAYVRVLRSGYGVHRAGEPHGVWHDLSGRVIGPLPGVPVEPLATDGTDDGVLLVASPDLADVSAIDTRSGTELWRVPFSGGRVPVARDGAVVVVGAGRVVSVDVRTGAERWRTAIPDVVPHAGSVTDGRTVVVVVERGRTAELMAVDLDDGSARWRAAAPRVPGREGDAFVHDMSWVWLGSLAGRVVLLTEAGMTALD